MHRFTFVLLAACGGSRPASAPVTNLAETARYSLEPVRVSGGEGRHSASRSSTTISGVLEVRAQQATLRLELATERAPIRCPDNDGSGATRQACAPADAQPSSSTTSLVLTGSSRWERGTLTIAVRKDDRAATLTCSEAASGLDCAVETGSTLVDDVAEQPGRLVLTPMQSR